MYKFWTRAFLSANPMTEMIETSLTIELHVLLYTRSSCMYMMLFVEITHLEWCFDHITSSVYN